MKITLFSIMTLLSLIVGLFFFIFGLLSIINVVVLSGGAKLFGLMAIGMVLLGVTWMGCHAIDKVIK